MSNPPEVSDEGMARIREGLDKADAQIRQHNAELKERADWLEEIILIDPARFRRALGIFLDDDWSYFDTQETQRLAAIKAARLRREAQNG